MARLEARHILLAAAACGAALWLGRSARGVRTSTVRHAGADGRGPGHDGACRHRVVVVGAGFGGLAAALPLAGDPGIDLTVVDAHNHHLFQPLLYQVATASLSPSDIAAPLRTVLPPSDRSRVVMATVSGLDTRARRVVCDDGGVIPYDDLVVATGSRTSYFGHDGWARDAPGLKTLDDAQRLRNDILSALERAARTRDERERTRLLTFVLVGGGPTGVEMAGSIGEMLQNLLERDYEIPAARARIILADAAPRILGEFADDLSAYAARALRRLGVEIHAGKEVTAVREGEVDLGGEAIRAGTIIWTAGTRASPVADWLGVKPARGGRVEVDGELRVPGHPAIRVVGDAAEALDPDGKPFPGLASVAKQQGAYAADAIQRGLRARPAPAPFAYRDYGILAIIGRNEAVAQFGSFHVTGRPAWLLWAGVHIAFLISFRSKLIVGAQWALTYATHQRGASLILEAQGVPPASAAEPVVAGQA